MADSTTPRTAVSDSFFAPLHSVYQNSGARYGCRSISDAGFAMLGVLRCLTHAKSGHEFLQHHADHGLEDIGVSHFFKALQSKRRGKNLASLNSLLRPLMVGRTADPFAAFRELDGFDIFAAEGHYHHAACYDPKPDNPGERAIASGHFFRLDLRSHHLGHLDTARPADGKKKAHDTTVIKRATAATLRDHAPAGRKIIYAWDKACIDYHLWHGLKHNHGVYFITLEKENSAAKTLSVDRLDRADPRNAGLHSDHYVGTSNGVQLRRIVYTDPRDAATYTYLTNEFTLPARLVVLIYKHRWDIEKVFHQLKSKMNERKSWASTQTAKANHALFECLAHNLALLFERHLMAREGLADKREEKLKEGRIKHRRNREGAPLVRVAGHFIHEAV